MLQAKSLGIQFGGLKAVDDFNIEIGESELVGLIGPNGAGKTTVFNLITGVYKPTEGFLLFNGERMDGKKTHQIVKAGIARTFQNIRLFKKMTVIENIEAAMNDELTYGMFPMIFRTPNSGRRRRRYGRGPGNFSGSCIWRERRRSWPRIFPTASSAAWRLRGPWPRI